MVHDPSAVATDRLPEKSRDEFRRKVRTLSGNFQLVMRLPRILIPWRNPIWFQFISHKLLRLAVPWSLLAMLISSALIPSPFYRIAFFAQLAGYLLALTGANRRIAAHLRLASAASSFVVLNSAAWVAFWVWITGRSAGSWNKTIYAPQRSRPHPMKNRPPHFHPRTAVLLAFAGILAAPTSPAIYAASPRVEITLGKGKTYYVSPDGNDSAAGTEKSPFKTLQRAADTVHAGDTVNILPGTYTTGMNLIGRPAGIPDNPIAFIAQDGVTLTHCAAKGANASLAAINIESTSGWVIIQGFHIKSDGSMQRARHPHLRQRSHPSSRQHRRFRLHRHLRQQFRRGPR